MREGLTGMMILLLSHLASATDSVPATARDTSGDPHDATVGVSILSSLEEGPLMTFEELHRLAVRHHPDWHSATEQVVQADAMIQSAWSLLLPSLSANANVTMNKNEVVMAFPQFDPQTGNMIGMENLTIQERWQSGLGMTLNMTLFNARSIPAIQMAYDVQEQTRLQVQKAKSDLLFAVTSAGYQMIHLAQLAEVSAQNAASAEAFHQMAIARQSAGQATSLDVLRSEIQLIAAQKQLEDAVESYVSARSALGILLGRSEPFRVTVPDPMVEMEGDIATLTQQALAHRVEMSAARIDMDIARRNRTETQMRFVPRLDLTWQWNASSVEGFSGDRTNWMLIFGAHWNILEGGGRLAELKKNRSQIRVTEHRLDRMRMEIETEVDQQVRRVMSRRRHLLVSKKTAELSERTYHMTRTQYEVGTATGLDVLTAQTDLVRSRIQLVLEQLQYDLALLALHRFLGEYHALSLN